MSMRSGVAWVLKGLAVYAAVIAGMIAGGLLFYRDAAGAEGFDAEAAQRLMFLINAAHAAMLCVLASHTRLPRLHAAALLFAVYFGVQSLLTLMEAAYFAESIGYPADGLPRDLGAGALTALAGAAAAAVLFGRPAPDEGFSRRPARSLAWRFAAATALYPVAYWLAGMFIALQSEAVRAFYGAHIDAIDPANLLAFQFLRGAMWAGLAFAAAHGLRGARLGRGALAGTAFAVFMAAQLFYPNPLMPEAVRMAHLVEIAVSNFLYGLVAVLLLAPRRQRG